MKLQTNIPLSAEENQIGYTSKVLLLGSCFTENIGEKLKYLKFQNCQNPFGIVFHPLAIEQLVARAVQNTDFTEADVFERDDQWFCFETHSSVTATSKVGLVKLLNKILQAFSVYIKEASHMVLTYGTAWVYRHNTSNALVANCHKLPQREFSKELLSVTEISASITRTLKQIATVNQNVQTIITVSPVRHLKDGFVENMRSKAHLISGIHEVLDQDLSAVTTELSYFPSYEIMMDELRDYRFYADDMLHPSKQAIHYIWQQFKQVWIASETEALQKQIDAIQKGLRHTPFHAQGASHLKFQQDLQQKIEKVQQQLPQVEFS